MNCKYDKTSQATHKCAACSEGLCTFCGYNIGPNRYCNECFGVAHTAAFLKDAEKGGYDMQKYNSYLSYCGGYEWDDELKELARVVLMDPRAWRAYWRTKTKRERGLIGKGQNSVDIANESTIAKAAHQCMRELIDALNEGKSAEEYLGSL